VEFMVAAIVAADGLSPLTASEFALGLLEPQVLALASANDFARVRIVSCEVLVR
jgi:hypothetical protein